ncbi:hypothetical protein ANCCEY_09219 [Ancylostoma ceylanicum]|uniref:ShKT domain-containing protein n=1 Tax=Ancylostoma ceylanicum TaxID=53326 RepID=A0A0D6LHY5_9BILA|nr:hypothetical protein ANCCEY_09219 [Ancylostoma ceylanicum]
MKVQLLILAIVHLGSCELESRRAIVKATKTPCCVDTLLPGVCRALYNRNHAKFTRQCRTNPDFSFIQCCHSCHFNDTFFTGKSRPVVADLYRKDAEELLMKNDPLSSATTTIDYSSDIARNPKECQRLL